MNRVAEYAKDIRKEVADKKLKDLNEEKRVKDVMGNIWGGKKKEDTNNNTEEKI